MSDFMRTYQAEKEAVAEAMAQFVEGVHFRRNDEGKPTLMDAGAALLRDALGLYPYGHRVLDLRTEPGGHLRAVVAVTLYERQGGRPRASGIGSASSRELLAPGRRLSGDLDPGNVACKLAAKRAEVDAMLGIPAVCERFAQDVGLRPLLDPETGEVQEIAQPSPEAPPSGEATRREMPAGEAEEEAGPAPAPGLIPSPPSRPHGLRPRPTPEVVKADAGRPLSRWNDIPEVKKKTAREQKAREIFSEAIIARDNKDYHRARALFEKAIDLFPLSNFFDAYAAMEKQLGNWDKVRSIYHKAIQFFSEDRAILEKLAMAERRAGNLDKCVNILKSALAKYPDNLSLSLNLAHSLVEFAERYNRFDVLDEARRIFTQLSKHTFLNVQNRSHYHKMWILHQPRSRVAWLLLRTAGFRFVRSRVSLPEPRTAPINAWILTDPRQFRYSDLFGLDGNVLLYCHYGGQVTEAVTRRAEETLKQLVQQDTNIKSDLLFLVVPELDRLEPYLRALLEDPENHPTVIPIEEKKAEGVLDNPEALHAYLEQLLSEWVFRRDLYKGNFPVSGRRFFGREREIRLLNQSINDGRSVGIFGLRKSGKTSLFYQLRLIHKADLVAYVDPEASPVEDCTWLCWRAVMAWSEGLSNLQDRLLLKKYRSENELPEFHHALQEFAADLTTLMSALSADARVILMIDEIEKVIPVGGTGWAHSFEMFRFLRGVAQESAGRFVAFVAGANPALCEMAQWRGEDNPVFQFFEEMFLPLLSESECKTMVISLGKGMGVEWDEDALRFVYQLTGGHPYMTRRVCSTLINKFPQRPLRVTVTMVKAAQPELLMRLDELFSEIKLRLQRDYPEEWDVLEALADGFALDEIKQLVPQWARALRHLEGYQLIEMVGGQPKFKMELLYSWIRGNGG